MALTNLVDELGVTRLRVSGAGGGSQPGASRWLGPCKISVFTQQYIDGGGTWTNADGGTLTLTVNGETTAAIAFDADAAAVKAALDALASITAVEVTIDGGGTITSGSVVVSFDDVEATSFLTSDAAELTGEFAPYNDTTAASGNASGVLVVEMFTPAAGDIVEDFVHAVVTAFDAGDQLTYTDDPDDPDGNGPTWSNPSSAQAVGGIDVQTPDDSFTNFYGSNSSGVRSQPSSLTALAAQWALTASDAGTDFYGNLPNAVKNAVPIYTVIQGVSSATEGEVWIWVKKATPTPLMD